MYQGIPCFTLERTDQSFPTRIAAISVSTKPLRSSVVSFFPLLYWTYTICPNSPHSYPYPAPQKPRTRTCGSMHSTWEQVGIALALLLFDAASTNLPHSHVFFAIGEDPNPPPLFFSWYKTPEPASFFPHHRAIQPLQSMPWIGKK